MHASCKSCPPPQSLPSFMFKLEFPHNRASCNLFCHSASPCLQTTCGKSTNYAFSDSPANLKITHSHPPIWRVKETKSCFFAWTHNPQAFGLQIIRLVYWLTLFYSVQEEDVCELNSFSHLTAFHLQLLRPSSSVGREESCNWAIGRNCRQLHLRSRMAPEKCITCETSWNMGKTENMQMLDKAERGIITWWGCIVMIVQQVKEAELQERWREHCIGFDGAAAASRECNWSLSASGRSASSQI